MPIAQAAAVRVEGADLVSGERAAAAHEFDGVVHLEPRAGDRYRPLAALVRVAVDDVGREGLVEAAEAHGERRLGEAVAREQRLGPQAAGRELLGEAAQRAGIDRLGAAPEHAHPREIPLRHLLRPGAPRGERVGEVRCERDGAARPVQGVEPDGGIAHEGQRGDERHADLVEDGTQHEADEPHVVVEGQPAHARIGAAVDLQPVAHDGPGVRAQASVRHLDPPRRRGAAGGELQERDVVRARIDGLARGSRGRLGAKILGGDDAAERRHPGRRAPQSVLELGGRRQVGGLGLVHDGREAASIRIELAERQRRGQGHGDDAGPRGAEKRGHEVPPVRHHDRETIPHSESERAQVSGAVHRLGPQPIPAQELFLPLGHDEREPLVGSAAARIERGDQIGVIECRHPGTLLTCGAPADRRARRKGWGWRDLCCRPRATVHGRRATCRHRGRVTRPGNWGSVWRLAKHEPRFR